MAYRYYSILRPIGPGTFPRGKEVIGIHNFDYRKEIKSIDHYAWGYIDFADPLTDEESKNYDLVPERKSEDCCGNCFYFDGEVGDGYQFCDNREMYVRENGCCFRYKKKYVDAKGK